ncbi:MAG: DegV family protein [Lachnospiraceae bacterium]|nr:DegV family protein [Lachnospiraceae bacterium]
MEYIIFTDVSVDVDMEYAAAENVCYVPMEYMLGEESRHCAVPESSEYMHAYYDKLREKVPTRTSQITPFNYVSAFEETVKEGKGVLYIALSSGLSNTYESALNAVEMLKDTYPDAVVEVVDSLGATGGMGLLVESACENKKKGMTLAENAAWLRENAGKINYWFKVEDLMYLSRGGRVSTATAIFGTALNIKPILNINAEGKLDTVAKKRGNKQSYAWMLEQFARNYNPEISNLVYISCADCMQDAQEMAIKIAEIAPDAKIKCTMLSPIIGAHTGPDMIALIYYGTARE